MHILCHTLPEAKDRGGRIEARLAIIGIGQSLRGDDAAGLEAVQTWQRDYPDTARRPEIRVACVEVPGLALLDMLQDVEAAVIVDAVGGDGPAGTVHDVGLAELESFSSSSKSAHGWGVAETLRLGRSLSRKLDGTHVFVIGIEAAQYALGGGLSPAVQEALPRASAAIQERVERALKT